ncbi:hypothetical protein CORMATOL_02424 [Corynebacterium matruchotii ATCC 33806]|uniref:Uncharacterized protein n=1 Tax=Corynebacterium matruchotii ATCC 33806 TaxID=566549 RepID=C0E5Z1_9CORY|nr:hypothetical protein CORMATOL_02424 [Corynebacterium matruchotii ATCC 33806]
MKRPPDRSPACGQQQSWPHTIKANGIKPMTDVTIFWRASPWFPRSPWFPLAGFR